MEDILRSQEDDYAHAVRIFCLSHRCSKQRLHGLSQPTTNIGSFATNHTSLRNIHLCHDLLIPFLVDECCCPKDKYCHQDKQWLEFVVNQLVICLQLDLNVLIVVDHFCRKDSNQK